MRIKELQLSWFRGAADPVSLDLGCKSMVVYGVNGSGKSSFVDAIEYVLQGGKVGHLAHEYSGRRQEKAITNTHRPKGRKTELQIKFKNGSEASIEINKDGSSIWSGAAALGIHAWDYQRTVLRQHEVSHFIHDTKGEKYSALLPLLGLHELEIAAENLRQLAKSSEEQSGLRENEANLVAIRRRREEIFGAANDDEILATLDELYARYCTDSVATEGALSRCKELERVLDKRMEESSAEQRRYFALQEAAELDLSGQVDEVRSANAKLVGFVEPTLNEKLRVLQSTGAFVEKLGEIQEVECPACGRSIRAAAFQAHVEAERARLHDTIEIFNARTAAIGSLCDSLRSLRVILAKTEIQSWREELAMGPLAGSLLHLEKIDSEALRASCGEEDLKAVEERVFPIIDAAASACQDAPSDAHQLSSDREMVRAGRDTIAAKELAGATACAEALVSFIKALEQGVREEIRLRSQEVIDDVSSDVQAMWATLHPGEAIEDVRLYLPGDADKAIDIGLKFHGVEQDSPRLTLSEGFRNSLGLCIFLALAKRESDNDRPLFLDDVVVSLDRNHRGMIAELLEKEFSSRQVVILTHDREWFGELRHQLSGKGWATKALLPYEAPYIGIRWSQNTTTFGDARAHVEDRPDSAANDARKIMDMELSLVAEALQLRLPYRRGDKNDRRVAHDFLRRLVGDGKKCFKIRCGEDYKTYTEAIDAFKRADRLLVSWGNRGSHTFDVVPSEAIRLINVCEEALSGFKCSVCGKDVWYADAEGSKSVQCQCGRILWRYGKG